VNPNCYEAEPHGLGRFPPRPPRMNVPRACPIGSGTARIGPRMSRPSALRTTRSFATRSPPRPLVLDSLRSDPDRSRPHADNGSSGAAPVRELIPPGHPIVLLRTMTGARHADHAPLDPASHTGDGSSQPPHLFKTTTEHDLPIPPSTTTAPGLRIRPILEVFSPARNGSSGSVSLNKTTTEHDPPPPPATRPPRTRWPPPDFPARLPRTAPPRAGPSATSTRARAADHPGSDGLALLPLSSAGPSPPAGAQDPPVIPIMAFKVGPSPPGPPRGRRPWPTLRLPLRSPGRWFPPGPSPATY
jgi:hypothetical protein